jgi:hypothetical protein
MKAIPRTRYDVKILLVCFSPSEKHQKVEHFLVIFHGFCDQKSC